MTDRETIRQIIAEELARPEVQRELTERVSQSLYDRIGATLRHPFAITVAGFVLTFFVGSLIENALAESRREAQQRAELIEVARSQEAEASQVIQDFVNLVYERAVEATLLRSAIERASTPEILERKAAYDAAYRTWNKREPEYIWALRRVHAGDNIAKLAVRSPYEYALTGRIGRNFSEADKCLTENFDRAVNAILSDREVTNRPNTSCKEADWSSYVISLTESAKRCASIVQAVGLIALRQKTETRIAEIRGEENPIPDDDRIPEDFARSCNLNG